MMQSIFLKTLYDRRNFIIGWTLGLVVLSMLMVSFFPAMRQDDSFDALIANMPAAFQGLIGDLENLKSFDRYLASQLFDIRVAMIAGIMAIILGVGLSTREEESGELRTILSLPISRMKLFVQRWLALVVVVLITVIGLVAGVYIVLPFIEDATISASAMTQLAAMTVLVMATFASVTYAAGMATGKKSFATLFGILVIVGSFLLSTFAAVVDWLQDIEFLSLLYYFPAVDIVVSGIDWTDAVVLSSVTVASLLISWYIFRRRDIN